MQLRITIDCDNAAFGENERHRCGECAEILMKLANSLRYDDRPNSSFTLFDHNGNRVGVAEFTE